jgi:hypothetical protein
MKIILAAISVLSLSAVMPAQTTYRISEVSGAGCVLHAVI